MCDDNVEEKHFLAEVAKTGRAACKKCSSNCDKNELRLAKLLPSPFGSGKMKHWYHVDCLFQAFATQRVSTRKIQSASDIEGWDVLNEIQQKLLLKKIKDIGGDDSLPAKEEKSSTSQTTTASPSKTVNLNVKDNSFREFRRMCDKIGSESSYLQKSKVLAEFFTTGSDGKSFQGDIYLWTKMLLPMTVKRVFNLQSKQLVKLFSRIFNTSHNEMLKDLENGDVAETVAKFFEQSKTSTKPSKKSELYLHEVDKYLDELTSLTKEEDQIAKFEVICSKCTTNDLKMIIRLIKHDLRINAGPKHILEALSKDAYTMLQNHRNLEDVIRKFGPIFKAGKSSSSQKSELTLKIMTPVMPMLAEACKSLDTAIEKCPKGMYSEIKYDGERVQLHKQGSDFKFFSRNLKPVMEHKVKNCRDFVGKAFPDVKDIILDAEIIMVDSDTGELLPFGTLGVHKREALGKSAEVCLFIFDCLYLNGENLMSKPLKKRREILQQSLKPIKNKIQLSESKFLSTREELSEMIAYVFKKGLEGLVLKKVEGTYEPHKRHWLKIKKDYLLDGSIADSADLVVLGAWFGTGKKGGLLSIFLMGCYDEKNKVWKTVTKAHSGLDDQTIDELQQWKEKMSRTDAKRLPKWLSCKKSMAPDFVANNPKEMPVFEIVGAEFLKGDGAHTADGMSIRFPRIKRIRDDKSANEATTLQELHFLFRTYKEKIDEDIEKLTKLKPSENLLEKYFSPEKTKKRKKVDEEGEGVSDSIIKEEKEEKSIEIEESPVKKCRRVFEGIRAFIPEKVKVLIPKDSLRTFREAGGAIEDKSPDNCTHVLHESGKIEGDLHDLRRKYHPAVRHVHYSWMEKSVGQMEAQPVIKHSVLLKIDNKL